jgi:hypothetical protein
LVRCSVDVVDRQRPTPMGAGERRVRMRRRRTGEAGSPTSGPEATVTGDGGLNWVRMQIQTNSNKFKSFQTLIDQQMTFLSLKKLK